jgi:hypothetical protein
VTEIAALLSERGGFFLIRDLHKRGLTPAPNEADDNEGAAPHAAAPFDEKAWRRKYMKHYMRQWRRRVKALKDGG